MDPDIHQIWAFMIGSNNNSDNNHTFYSLSEYVVLTGTTLQWSLVNVTIIVSD